MQSSFFEQWPVIRNLFDAISILEIVEILLLLIGALIISRIRRDLKDVREFADGFEKNIGDLESRMGELGDKFNQVRVTLDEVYRRLPEDVIFDQGRERYEEIAELWREAKTLIEDKIDDVKGKRPQKKLAKMSRHDYARILEYLSKLSSMTAVVTLEAARMYRALAAIPHRLRGKTEITKEDDVQQMRAALEAFKRAMSVNGDEPSADEASV